MCIRDSSETDEEGGVTRYTYDAEGNTLTETDPEGGVTEYLYNGCLLYTSRCV